MVRSNNPFRQEALLGLKFVPQQGELIPGVDRAVGDYQACPGKGTGVMRVIQLLISTEIRLPSLELFSTP